MHQFLVVSVLSVRQWQDLKHTQRGALWFCSSHLWHQRKFAEVSLESERHSGEKKKQTKKPQKTQFQGNSLKNERDCRMSGLPTSPALRQAQTLSLYVDILNVKHRNNPNELHCTLIHVSKHSYWHSYLSCKHLYSGAEYINIWCQREGQQQQAGI